MSSLNFDPEWAQHLKHDPDRPLAVDVKEPGLTWEECFAPIRAGQQKGPTPVAHNEDRDKVIKGQEPGQKSKAWIGVTLKIGSTGEEQAIPCMTSTSILELAEMLAFKLSIDPYEIKFIQRRGALIRQMYPHEQVERKMMVKGITSFTRQPYKYKDPKVIVGAGHLGLRMAMFLHERKQLDFVVFDRMGRVGGTSWMYQANSTSKLQTEYGAYHLAFGEDYPIPTCFTTPWPSRNALLNMFQMTVEQEGVMPYIKLNTNVKEMSVVSHDRSFTGPKALQVIRYELTTENMAGGRLKYGKLVAKKDDDETPEEEFHASCVCMFPGNLTLPRQETYKGEDAFGGDIGYAMFNEIDYHKLEGLNVTIVGHGAFAVENIRTCCEFGVHQIYLVCRRRNLACPRVVSWMANRTFAPLNNVKYMQATEPMYKLIDLDPWTYHSVQTNEKRSVCQITQKARFGIGDIYFLTIYMGKVEVCLEPGGVKRVTKNCVHLDSGRKLECHAILKLLGLVGEMDNDRLMKVKELVGFWVNEDPRRYLVAEPLSVMCSQMGGTSFSPGAYSWSLQGLYFLDFPTDFASGPLASGMLPRHKADMSDEQSPRPAHVVDARHGTQTAMTIGMFTPGMAEVEANSGFVKAMRHRLCHPIKKFLAQAKEDWDYYAKRFLEEGFGVDKDYPTYPYNPQNVTELYQQHMADSGEPPMPCDGPDLALCNA